MASAINLDDAGGGLNAERLAYVKQLLQGAHKFVNEVYIPDLMAIASFYKDWGAIGDSKFKNYLVYGDLPTDSYRNHESYKWPRGIILDGDLSKVHDVNLENTDEIQEFVNKSWYNYAGGNDKGLHPYDGETDINYTGPKPPYDYLDVDKAYSFVKTPRWQGKPMEVGPLSRMLVGFGKGIPEYKEVVTWALTTLDVPVAALFSTLGRTAARGLETKLLADWGLEFFDQLIANIKNGDTRMAN